MWIKRILFLLPLLVGLLFLTSFVVARKYFALKENQFVMILGAEPDSLNPYLSQSVYSALVESLLFNGLVKMDPDLNLEGDLAKSWEIEQESIFFLSRTSGMTSEESLAAIRKGSVDGRLGDLSIKEISSAGRKITVRFEGAGRSFEEPLLKLIPEENIAPIYDIYVRIDTKRKLPDGRYNSSEVFLEGIREKLAEFQKSGKLVETSIESSGLFYVRVLEESDTLKRFLEEKLAVGEKESLGSVERIEALRFINEPIITFHLRDDVLWHDGVPFTSEDVVFSYEVVMDERTNTVRRPLFEPVKRVEALDPWTVRVRYKRPYVPGLENWGMGIIPKHILEGKDINKAPFNRKPIGTGPFRFEEWVTAERVVLKANERYFEGRPYLDKVSFRIVPENAIAELEFMTKGGDFWGIPFFKYKRYEEDPRFETFSIFSGDFSYVGWNLQKKLFQDVRVRKALCMAVNREAIVKYLTYGKGEVATGPFSARFWYGNPDVKPLPYDPEAAKRLLAEAGWEDIDGDGVLEKDGQEFRFTLSSGAGEQTNIPVLIQSDLKKIGVKMDIETLEWTVFETERLLNRHFDAVILGWSIGTDPDQYEIWHSSQIGKGFNFVGYSNPEVDRLLELGRSEYDRQKRKAIYHRLHEIIYDDQPYLFLVASSNTFGFHSGEFKIRKRTPQGPKEEPMRITQAGVFYEIKDWFRTRSAQSYLRPE